MIDNAGELRPEWVAGKERVGVTAGASAPEILVRQVIDSLRGLGATGVQELEGATEKVTFPLPKALAESSS
jgi:4-hydroxy-3-methylbut-2-enyl diphosphate reductase